MDINAAHWLFGMIGGILIQFLGLWKICKKDISDWPQYYKRASYLIPAAGMIVIGGFLAWLQLRTIGKPDYMLAMQLGATAPLFLERMAANPPEIAQ